MATRAPGLRVANESAAASVVFLRAVNVGGHQTFQPSALAGQLAAFDVVPIGAAGTFVVRKKVGPAELRTEILRRLSFEPELMICSARELLALAGEDFPAAAPAETEVGVFVTVLSKPPRRRPRLPLDLPADGRWEVRVAAIRGRFVLSYRRKIAGGRLYPNAIVEKLLGVTATTRNWNTIVRVAKLLAT